MSAQPPAQNIPQTPGTNDSGEEQPLRTRYYLLIMTAMVVIGIVVDIAIFIGIITNAEGTVRIPYLVFILPVVVALGIGRFADAALARKSPHLVPGYVAPHFQGGHAPQQGQYGQAQYGQPAAQPMAPQNSGYGQVPGQQATQSAPQQPQYGQAPTDQDPRNQQPYGQNGYTS